MNSPSSSVVFNLPNVEHFNIFLHVVVILPIMKLFLLLLNNCSFATVMNHDENICVFSGDRQLL